MRLFQFSLPFFEITCYLFFSFRVIYVFPFSPCCIFFAPWTVTCSHLVPPSCLYLSTTLVAFMLLHYLTTVSSLLCLHTKVYPFILSTIVIIHDFHIYHIWPCSCYIVIQPYFHNKLRSTILLKYIYSWTDIRTYASNPDFTNIIRSMKVYEGHK